MVEPSTNHGNLNETNSTYTDNNANHMVVRPSTIIILSSETNSTFNQNYSTGDDGIIFNTGGNTDTPVTITDCTFTNNNGEAIWKCWILNCN